MRELWEAPQTPTVFPVTVWRFLNWPLSGEAEYRTRREELTAEWQNDGLIGKPGKRDRGATLLFGTGGTYEIDDLYARAQMLEVVKTSLSVMGQYYICSLKKSCIISKWLAGRPHMPGNEFGRCQMEVKVWVALKIVG